MSGKRYNPKTIEPKWQKIWADRQIYRALDGDNTRRKFVMLTEFPYPSGDGLHLGPVREYSLGDIVARFKRMNGYNVLFPMGYDAFGLPTENYAIKHGIAPQLATDRNVRNFQKQFDSLGFSIDWSRTFRTSDPDYYRWTQWLFLQFVRAGLAYRDEISINWCPECKTGLANEEVVNGRHERCDTIVEKRLLKQWLLKITAYADRLIDGLKDVDYPSKIADQQINWIGRSKGAEIDFVVESTGQKLTVFTTRPDTIFGATFLVLAPEHAAVASLVTAESKAAVNNYIKQSQAKSEIERQETEREKTGVFSGGYAINPVNQQRIPIWIADYVLSGYGTGAIMAVPAHDERDYAFAAKYSLPIVRVIKNDAPDDACTHEEGVMINSGKYDGLESFEAREAIVHDLQEAGTGKERINYKLRDWIFSRQHYWGEPIPIIYCPEHGTVPLPDDQLPVTLPEVEKYVPGDSGESPLAAVEEWVNTICPLCGGPAKRETDTMPNWAGSSWYYLRYYDPHNRERFAAIDKLQYWGEVDLYLGGMEHTTLHLLYSRFWHQFLFDQGLVPTPEPYHARRGQGIVLAADGTKMSKSKGNIVNPNDILEQGYGADALHLAIAFLAPYDQTTFWSPEGVAGTFRFIQRVWNLIDMYNQRQSSREVPDDVERQLKQSLNRTVARVSADLEEMSFNTAVAALMEWVNTLYKLKEKDGFRSPSWRSSLLVLVQLLAPFAPHVTEELWQQLGQEDSVHISHWPVYDPAELESETMLIVVQINGKLRAQLELPSGTDEQSVLRAVYAHDKIAAALKDKQAERYIYVPGKLVNLVV